MWQGVFLLIVHWRSNIRSLFKISLLKFLLILLIAALLYLGWEKWLLTIPQPLPQQSINSADKKGDLLDGSYYETSIPPTGTDKYLSAKYRLWVPNEVQTVRGLIVKQHGCGDAAAATGLDHANDLQWQALALKHQFALLGTKLSVGDRSCDDWALLNSGSGDAFLKALHRFAKESHHTELDQVPWALWGHSGGADWAAQMLQKYPDRTISAVLMRCGGITFPSTISSTPLRIPVLFAVAEKESVNASECRDLAKNVFSRYRKAGALWGLAAEADTGHESGNTRLLAIPYLDAIMTTRLMASDTKMRPIDEAQGWLGHAKTHAVEPIKQYEGDPLEASWLPGEETARKWQQYGTTNAWNQLSYNFCRGKRFFSLRVLQRSVEDCYRSKVALTRRPVAPTNVRIARIGKAEILLAWSFYPDLENGLPSFRVYRDGSLIKTLQGQGHNFGDAPSFPHIALEFRDKKIKDNAVYTVSAFNVLGESVSQPAQLIGGI